MPKYKLNLVFLSGAGAVGKTSVAEALVELSTTNRVIRLVRSTTRASYAAMGIPNEKLAADMDEHILKALQERIYKDYVSSLIDNIARARLDRVAMLVVDRSPYDYVSYFIQLFPNLGLTDICARMHHADNILSKLNDDKNLVPALWFFEYPTSWSSDDRVEKDLFRRAQASKNFVWSALLENLIRSMPSDASENLKYKEVNTNNFKSPTERAKDIYVEAFGDGSK